MNQLQLPLTLPEAQPEMRLIQQPRKYRLPLGWKAIFIILILYSASLSAVIFFKASSTYAKTTQPLKQDQTAVLRPDLKAPQAHSAGTQVKMTASVNGWYDILRIDNKNILVKTNMKVWVNDKEFIRCNDCGQRTTESNLLEF